MTTNLRTINAVIVDDEPLARKRIKNLLSNYPNFRIVAEADNGAAAVQIIDQHSPDVVFLDIGLPGIDGFKILEHTDTARQPLVIVVSASEEHALKAFDYFAFDYLLKPYLDRRFEQAIDKLIEQLKEKEEPQVPEGSEDAVEAPPSAAGAHLEFIPIKKSGKILFIKTDLIEFIQASGYYIELKAEQKKHLLRQSMNRMIDQLDPDKFVRIHRSVIINLNYMSEIARNSRKEYLVKMHDGHLFKVSKSHKKHLFAKLNL